MSKPFVCVALGAAGMLLQPALADAQPTETADSSGSPPLMDHDQTVHCVPDPDGVVWRVQCDEKTKICLYARNKELSSDGKPVKSLERARRCAPSVDMSNETLKAKGFTLKPGRVDAPYGWTRDDRGRVFQINFDLKRRLYLGAAYMPALKRHVAGTSKTRENARSTVDFGLLVLEHWGGEKNPTRHRIRLVEGEIAVAPFAADLTLLKYDVSRRYPNPLVRVTTFFGEPRRHDLTLNVGFWFEGMKLESHQNDLADSNLWKFAAAHGTIDILQSRRIDSYLRLRSGIGIERLYSDGVPDRGAITWGSALELDWVVDQAGFHNLRGELAYELPRYFDEETGLGETGRRMKAEAAYEVVVLAINDQPLSARFSAKAERRNDIPGLSDRWGVVAGAGLRFSLWAPPRRK